MPNFTGKSGGGPHAMKMYGQGKNPIQMDHAMKFNAELKQASADGKLSGKFKEVVDNSPTNMGHAMKKYGAHKMSHPMKGYKSAAQRKAVHASKADGGKGNPKKMYKK